MKNTRDEFLVELSVELGGIQKLASYLGVNQKTLYQYRKRNADPGFEILNKINLLVGDWNQTMANMFPEFTDGSKEIVEIEL